ncbi:MAG TPA: hypothetical protein VKX25_03285 [Bryobacteraceae bacterium]|jgi:hypothetical protein|nr:hypothetical protein [Bryobacteraceae bacterium]
MTGEEGKPASALGSAVGNAKSPCQNCAGGPSIKFSGMFLFEPKGNCVVVHVPQVASHGYLFKHPGSKKPIGMERNDVWSISCHTPQQGDISSLTCPELDSFTGLETNLRYCQIIMPLPCCVKPIQPEQVSIQGPVKQTGDNTIYHYFVLHYSADSVLTVTSDSGCNLALSKGALAKFHAEPMSGHGRAAPGHVQCAFRELSRMCRKSDTITVHQPLKMKATGAQVAHCFSIKASNT